MRDYKVGDIVIWMDKEHSDYWEITHGIPLYGKVAKIIYMDNYISYLLEFNDYVNCSHGSRTNIEKKSGHCMWGLTKKEFTSLDHLKLKKLIKNKLT